MSAALVDHSLDYRPWKSANVFDAKVRSDFNRALPSGTSVLRLPRIQRIAVIHTDRRYADIERFGLRRQLLGIWLPLGIVDAAGAGIETHPFDRTKAQSVSPLKLGNFAAYENANTHDKALIAAAFSGK